MMAFLLAALAQDRGYTIPIMDLSERRDLQVVVDREPGQYLGHPTTALLADGKTVLCVYPKGHGKGAIVMKRSRDGGKTWSDRLPTPASWATSLETPTIYRVSPKRLLLFSGLYPIRLSFSEDEGATWSELKPVGDWGGIVAMSSLLPLKDGTLMALFHDDGRFLHKSGKSGKFVVYKSLSRDGGFTWSSPVPIATHGQAHLCEPGAIRTNEGIAVLLRENSRQFNSFIIWSRDEGKTWTDPVQAPAALTGDRHAGIFLPDGRLFISFRDTTLDSATKGDWVGWVGTVQDLRQGREGQFRVRLMKNYDGADCAYPGVEALADGTIVATTYGHWVKGEPPYIVCVRFKTADLIAHH